jgi:predicted metal-dependent hydrolase
LKSASGTIIKGIQRVLQLDFFSDFLVPDTVASAPTLSPSNEAPSPPNGNSGSNKRRILLQDQLVEYELRRSTRRSIGFLINDHGLRVTAPRWVTLAAIESAIRDKQDWIISKLRARQQRAAAAPKMTSSWQDGSALPCLGDTLTLRIVHIEAGRRTPQPEFDLDTKELIVTLREDATEQQLKERIKQWLQQEAKQLFAERLAYYAPRMGVTYQALSLSSATTRWGSCTSQGDIRLNWRLIHFSPAVIDYVVVHELAHRREMNHSPRFWAIVRDALPDYERPKRLLRQHAIQHLPSL